VRLSSRLTSSPASIVANEADINPAVRLRSYGMPSQPVLEINPRHPLIKRMNRDTTDPRLADWAHVLYNQSVLTLGAPVEDPAGFVSRLNSLLVSLAGEADIPAQADQESAG
jgi:molecular chaperone HtpG